jgi:hypothetical protein
VFAGAVVTASLSLALLALGAGFDLSSLSFWSPAERLGTLGAGTIAWILVVQIISASMGGYLAGRLRARWPRLHGDEVYFRDTAHGFLAWGLAVVVTAAFLTSAATHLAGASATPAEGRGASAAASYYADMLLRSDRPIPAGVDDAAQRAEVGRLLEHVVASGVAGDSSPADRAYLAQLATARTGLGAAEAANRVAGVIGQAQQAADAVRKITARILLWTFVALLCGAFSGSVAATIGGRQRDRAGII